MPLDYGNTQHYDAVFFFSIEAGSVEKGPAFGSIVLLWSHLCYIDSLEIILGAQGLEAVRGKKCALGNSKVTMFDSSLLC